MNVNKGFAPIKTAAPKVLVTDDVHPVLLQKLAAEGYDCVYQPNTTDAQVRAEIADYTGLIINSKINVDKAMLDTAVNLEFVGRLGSGMEIVDIAYANEKNVRVYSSPEGNSNAVAEHAVGLLFAVANNMVRADREVRAMNWQRERNRGFEIADKTIAVIGYGHTGSALVRKLSGLGAAVLVYDKYLPKGYLNTIAYATEADMKAVFAQADIVSIHLPLNAETKHLVNDNWINSFAKNIVLINTSRGKIADTASIIKNLQHKKLRAAGLDVFENEKPNTFTESEIILYNQLYEFDNVILTPHIAGWTEESKLRLATILADKIIGKNKGLAIF